MFPTYIYNPVTRPVKNCRSLFLFLFFNLLLPPKLQTPSFAAQIIPQKKTPFPALRARDTLIAVKYPLPIYNPVIRPV